MRLLSLLPASLLAGIALGQGDGIPLPGNPALTYTDGSFTEPNGGISRYTQGNQMNITWETTYTTVDIYLITGFVWGDIIQLTTNSAQRWLQWEVDTKSKNASEVYVFRCVNGTGTPDQKAKGGFLSATFNIALNDDEETTPTVTFSSFSTSVTQPAQTPSSNADADSTPKNSDPANSDPANSGNTNTDEGLSSGAKIGVGVGVGVGVLGVGALIAAFLFWRRSKNKKAAPQPHEMPLNGDYPPHYQNAQPYVGAAGVAGNQHPYNGGQQHYNGGQPMQENNPVPMAGYYKPPEHGETRGAELDGGQGHAFVPEAQQFGGVPRAELQ